MGNFGETIPKCAVYRILIKESSVKNRFWSGTKIRQMTLDIFETGNSAAKLMFLNDKVEELNDPGPTINLGSDSGISEKG